ncbi:DUF281 domain-containing protein [Caenorhabditis elegans]|uniref:DUF281 domain-containing protein n=1 Tax=Caenorhabditis elegans TaxID=6239 RepID=D6R8X7_CAEEL|nr:DUF281 domain-containing protein [Caenorhabditis elegans]CBL87053.2 DUF281 domain-containing protein [Caenorhabditis elegans]|eukprot:NP_001254347.1 Uncharacterized protein CELE_F49C5.11 [Caenorhabditis elegans]
MYWPTLFLFICILLRPIESCMRMVPPDDVGFTTEEPALTTGLTEATTEPVTTATETESTTVAGDRAQLMKSRYQPMMEAKNLSQAIPTDPTEDGCIQQKVVCQAPGGTLCESVTLVADTSTASVFIGPEDAFNSDATLTCNKDGTWSSGTTRDIEQIYCIFVEPCA